MEYGFIEYDNNNENENDMFRCKMKMICLGNNENDMFRL